MVKQMEGMNDLNDFAYIFKALGHPICLAILLTLSKDKGLCVKELVRRLDLPQPVISQKLKRLKTMNLVKCRREGQLVRYFVVQNAFILKILKCISSSS